MIKNILVIIVLFSFSGLAIGQSNLKVMTFHTSNGFGKDKKAVKTFQAWMKSLQLDVVGFQDLKLTGKQDLEKLAKKWGHTHTVFVEEADGRMTALCSKYPITKSTSTDFLKGKIQDTYFYVTLIEQDSLSERTALASAIAADLGSLGEQAKTIILGSFKGYAPADSVAYTKRFRLIPAEKRSDKTIFKKLASYQRSRNYAEINALQVAGLEDVFALKNPSDKTVGSTYPTRTFGLQPPYNTFRHDLILASGNLAANCQKVEIIKTELTDYLSDHYPVVATF